MKKIASVFIFLLCLAVVAAAYVFMTKKNNAVQPADHSDNKEVVLYNWEGYTDPSILEDFKKETGIKVVLKEYTLESECIAELQSDTGQYDVVITSARGLEKLKLAKPFDLTKIPNIKNVLPAYVGLEKAIPYLYGTTGLAINTDFVPADTDSWSVLWDKKYKGKIALLESPPEVIGAICFYIGIPLSGVEQPDNLKLVEKYAILLKENEPYFGETFGNLDKLLSGEKWIVHVYSGDVALKAGDRKNIKYILPQGGISKWTDYFMLCANAKNVDGAHKLVNFFLRPEIAARSANKFHYVAPIEGADKYIDKTCLNSETIFPSEEMLKSAVNLSGFDEMRNEHQRIFYLIKSK
ncbi:MAG: spermidine/putrescine ABC transporter substrate-binding protein [Phycisphaerae bacterium]|jgi:spermidine/putrescine transport system substrate-binding protein